MQSFNKIVLISGASSGLGRFLALEAADRGCKVALLARKKERLQKLSDHIQSQGGEALALPTDVGNPTEVKKAFSEIQQQWGRMDILINNAGVVEPIAPLVKCRDDALLQSLQTNVYGTYLCTREALKHMMEENREEGTIINITSGAAKKPYHGWSAYSSQKAAVDMFTRCVALEVKELPIRIAAIAPGTFESNMQELIRSKSEEDFPARPKFVKLHQEGHLSKPEDVAKSIVAIALSDWPELSGRITDIRSSEFQEECRRRGIEIRGV